MNPAFSDYAWKNGIPIGIKKLGIGENSSSASLERSHFYKIITDPYHKRYSVELYEKGQFQKVVYDSQLLDFRKITLSEQAVWQREKWKEEDDTVNYLIRSSDDRIILVERQTFDENQCIRCEVFSPQNQLICIQKMFYRKRGDFFDGVVLFDLSNKPIMYKKYTLDNLTGEFGELLEEVWEMHTLTKESEICSLTSM